MMRYGIFSMRWVSASRGSVSGSWDSCLKCVSMSMDQCLSNSSDSCNISVTYGASTYLRFLPAVCSWVALAVRTDGMTGAERVVVTACISDIKQHTAFDASTILNQHRSVWNNTRECSRPATCYTHSHEASGLQRRRDSPCKERRGRGKIVTWLQLPRSRWISISQPAAMRRNNNVVTTAQSS